MLQPEFAELIGFSASTITSVEIGRRPASRELSFAVAGKTGAMPEPILNHSEESVDSTGRCYSATSYALFLEARPNHLREEDMNSLVRPIKIALRAAADAGRLGIFAPMLRSSVEHLAGIIEGMRSAVEARLAHETVIKRKFTFAEIRKNSALAAALGLKGSEDRDGDDIACEVEATDTEKIRQPWFDGWYGITNANPLTHVAAQPQAFAESDAPLGTPPAPSGGESDRAVRPSAKPSYKSFV